MNFDYFDLEKKMCSKAQRDKRREKILKYLKDNDQNYAVLIKKRAEQSMILRSKLGNDIGELEKYMDLIYEQEIYELDAVYILALHDAQVFKNMRHEDVEMDEE